MTDRPPPKVLLVEDDFSIRRLLLDRLSVAGMSVLDVATLAEARSELSSRSFDLVLLDLGLPDGDGVDFVRELRRWSTLPVLVLSARHLDHDKVAALDAGADDYLSKPFSAAEMLARIRALTRRVTPDHSRSSATYGELHVDFAARRVLRVGEPVRVSPIEFDVLALLAAHAGQVMTYQQLLSAVWGPEASGQNHYVRIVLGHLRRKLESDPTRPRHLLTESGVGYRFQP